MSELKPPMNPRTCPDGMEVCGTCKTLEYDEYMTEKKCIRPHGRSFSPYGGNEYFYTCDLWESTEVEEKEEEGNEQ